MSEVQDRYQFVLDTPRDYYDQVVGMSQGIINKSFKTMFDQIKGIGKIYYDNKGESTLNATLDAPSVLIIGNTSSAAEIYYQLKIKEGYADLPSGRKLRLDGWVFSIQTPLKEVTLTPTDRDTPQIKKEKEEALKTLGKTYQGFVPGDYRVARVFCALAQARWYEPEGVWSTCGLHPTTKEPVSLMDWKKETPDNEADADDLMLLLQAWAKKQRDERLSSLGLQFELNKNELNAPEPTFRPVSIFTQVYPYRSKAYPNGVHGTGTYGKDGKMVPGDYNCLAYCENVDSSWSLYEDPPSELKARPLPAQPNLVHSANLAQPASDGEEIPGTFAMDYRVWLEYFLLPQLQELCSATQMWCGDAVRGFDNNLPAMWPKYALGSALEGMEAKPANHKDFKLVSDGARHYHWSQESSSHPPIYTYKTKINIGWGPFPEIEFPINYNDSWSKSKSDVHVNWDAGSNTIRVSGTIRYEFSTKFALDPQFTNDVHTREYTFEGKWSMSVVLTDPEWIVMEPKVQGLDSQGKIENFEVSTPHDVNQGTIGKAKEEFEDKFRTCLTYGIGKVAYNVKERFKNAGRFVFPGYGVLKFTQPRLTEKGSIIAIVDYAKPSGPDGTVVFPDPTVHQLEPPSKPVSETSTFPSEYVDSGKPKLHWSMDFKYNAESKLGRLTFVATNEEHNDPVIFEYIKLTLVPPAGTKRSLFNGDKWSKEKKNLFEQAAALFGMAKETLVHFFSEEDDKDSNEDERDVTESTTTQSNSNPPNATQSNATQAGTTQTAAKDSTSVNAAAEASTDVKPELSTSSQPLATSEPSATTQPPAADGHVPSLPSKDKQATVKPPKKRITLFDAGNVYFLGLSKGWVGDTDLEMNVKTNKRSLAVEALITPSTEETFSVARGEGLTIVLQGKVDGPGVWPINVREAWKIQNPAMVGKELSATDDWKIVEIFKDGRKPDYFDVSDRAAKLAEKRG